MKLIDTMNGPVWVVWAVGVLCAAISLLLLSGHGSWLIAGYNTASKKEKEKYDEKKLCRVMGCGGLRHVSDSPDDLCARSRNPHTSGQLRRSVRRGGSGRLPRHDHSVQYCLQEERKMNLP